jgi:hypothetical protein
MRDIQSRFQLFFSSFESPGRVTEQYLYASLVTRLLNKPFLLGVKTLRVAQVSITMYSARSFRAIIKQAAGMTPWFWWPAASIFNAQAGDGFS